MSKPKKFTETPDWKDIPKEDRLGYIWDYYKLPIMAAVCVIIAIAYTVIHAVMTPDNYAYFMAVNSNFEDEVDADHLFDDFVESRGHDPKKEIVFMDYTLQYDVAAEQQSLYDRMAIDTMISARTAEIFVSTISTYKEEANMGVFMPVSEYLTPQEMERFADDIIWLEPSDAEAREQIAWEGEDTKAGTKYARGIRVKGNTYMTRSNLYTKEADIVLGVVGNTKKPEIAKDLARYILGLDN